MKNIQLGIAAENLKAGATVYFKDGMIYPYKPLKFEIGQKVGWIHKNQIIIGIIDNYNSNIYEIICDGRRAFFREEELYEIDNEFCLIHKYKVSEKVKFIENNITKQGEIIEIKISYSNIIYYRIMYYENDDYHKGEKYIELLEEDIINK
jgi:hypothetical protein